MSRRAFLAASFFGALGLSGCQQSLRTSQGLPSPAWPSHSLPAPAPSAPAPLPEPVASQTLALPSGVLARSQWAKGGPAPTKMTRMLPVRYITVHHCAGPVFTEDDLGSTKVRLESIRRYHRESLGWGDIGYHFAVDRAGRIWQCRSLAWQGAHVADHNEGNIGVVVLGDFDQQQPSPAQVAALEQHLRTLMRAYGVPVSRVKTHQEWAPTACPGRNLQRYMVVARASGRMA